MTLRLRFGAVALVLAVAATAAPAADRPPAELHLVGDHWTAWNPPATLPPDAKVHIVVRGDTLWDISRQNLGNPYLWPQIWEKNQYVLDAHWIYPGDPIVVGVEVAPAEAVGALGAPGDSALGAPTDVAAAPGAGGAAEAGASAPRDSAADAAAARRASAAEARRNEPVPLGSESDIYCSGYIDDAETTFTSSVTGSEYESLTPRLQALEVWASTDGVYGRTSTIKYELTLGDIVYLGGGRAAGLTPGMVMVAIEPRETVRHPASRETLGRFHAYLGRVRVLTVLEDRALGEIVHSCTGLHVGATLRPFEPEPVPLARRLAPRPFNDPTTNDLSAAPAIVRADSSLFTLGQDHVVYIDRGESDDVFPGDLFTIYRPSLSGHPPVAVGELAVLSVRERTAVAKIVDSRYPVQVGDRLERR